MNAHLNTRLLARVKKPLIAYSFIAPNLAGFLLFTLFPIVFSLVLSFCDWDFAKGIMGLKFIGIKNYLAMWGDEWFISSLKNNAVYSLVTVTLTMGIALVFAVLVESLAAGKSLIRLLLYLPNITNIVVAAYVWQMMLSLDGIITQGVRFLGIKEPPMWLGDPHWAFPAIMAIGIWSSVGYVFVLYLSGLQNIPRSNYEAATIDGANGLQKFRYVTVPLLAPTTFFILITQLIFSFRVFGQVNILTAGGPGTSTSVLAYYIYVSAFRFYKMGYGAAITWVLFVVIFLFTLIQWRGQKKWDY